MNETKDLILKGCKFISSIGWDKWNSSLNHKAIARMRDLCQLQLDEWVTPKEPEEDLVALQERINET